MWEWAARGVAGYDEMTNLPPALRDELADAVPFSTLAVEDEAESADGTVKAPSAPPTGIRSRRC